MADQASKDEAAQRRIISHMNEDHHDSIIRYLEHYCKISSWKAYGGRISSIGLNEMVIDCAGNTHRIKFDPPMTSFREARERLVQMDKDCLQGLGKSDITVKEFAPPTGIYALEFAIVASTFLGFSQRWWFERGRIVDQLLGSGFARFCWVIQPWLIAFMVVLHSAELVYFIKNHLRRHSVNPRTLIFWQWVGTTFVEGQFAFKRFRDLVQQKARDKEKQKH